MNIEKYTERSRGFIQSAQSLAMREGHQQFSPLHLLKVLLDDSEGLASGLIDRAGGNSRAILKATEEALNKLPKVSGSGAGQVYLAPDLARAFDAAEKAAEKAGDGRGEDEAVNVGALHEEFLSSVGHRPYATGNWLRNAVSGPDQCIRISMSALTVPSV